jgi:hypothetical protein
MLNGMGVCLSNLARSDNGENEEDENNGEEDAELGKLSEDDESSRVMDTISNMVQHHMRRFQDK